jgi:hypothetical protein
MVLLPLIVALVLQLLSELRRGESGDLPEELVEVGHVVIATFM